VDEEAQAQVMARERGDVGLEPLARPQAREDVAREAGTRAVVAEERRRAVVAAAERRRLGGVVQQRAEAQREAAVHLVGEWLVEQRRDRAGVLVTEQRCRIGLQRHRLLEHLDRVRVDVGVVIAALLDAVQGMQLGQDRRGQPELVHQRQRGEHAVAREDPFQLGEHALLRHGGRGGRARTGEPDGVGVRRERELRRQAHETDDAQRVRRERARPDGAQPPGGEIVRATVRVHEFAAAQRLGDRVDGEVAEREVAVQRAAAQRAEIDLPGAVGRHHAPRAELVGELECRAARGPPDSASGSGGVAIDDDIQVRRRAPEQRVAHRAADDPGGPVAQRVTDHRQR
jgi:hypothetical protein